MEAWITDLRVKMKKKESKKRRNVSLWIAVLLITVCILVGYSWAKKEITINIDGKETTVQTFKNNVESLLKEQHIIINEDDYLEPTESTHLYDGMTVEVKRAFPVFIDVDDNRKQIKTVPGTVAEIIKKAGIKLNDLDIVEPELTFKIDKTKVINITRVTKKTIPKSQLEEVEINTKQSISRGGKEYRYEKVLNVIATAYTYTGNKTYTGITPHKGTVAVDPNVIPLGSRLYIEGYGYGVAQDTGGSIQGNKIDLFMEDEEKALQWGEKAIKVYILK